MRSSRRWLRRSLRGVTAFAIAGVVPMLAAAPAHASLTGPCEAQGTINGTVYNPKVIDEATIPRKATVQWEGSVEGSGEREISGAVEIKLPPPIGNQQIDDWGPSDSEEYSNSGTYEYDFPELIAGFDIPLTGFHQEPGARCEGAVIIRIDGGGISNPAAIASLVLTAISGTLLIVSARPKGVAR